LFEAALRDASENDNAQVRNMCVSEIIRCGVPDVKGGVLEVAYLSLRVEKKGEKEQKKGAEALEVVE